MNITDSRPWNWIWPHVGATPISQGLDSEMFDRTDYPYSETFVREAIQNSLDARLDRSAPVIVNFTFHSDGIGPRRAFLEQVMEFRMRAGLEIPQEWRDGHVRWLVVEDFNSRGLLGDLTKRTSDFWNYWLNFGLSNKAGSGLGGRGIGRVTFLIASRLQSVIGYTRRCTDSITAICGMSVLRAQEDGQKFLSTHAYLADRENDSIYELHGSPEFQSRVRKAFRFSGYDNGFESGLALAIPYPHKELAPDGILAAAIENFAPAIMNGTLVLNVDGTMLDASTIGRIAVDVSDRLNDEAIRSDAGRFLGLIARATADPEPFRISMPNAQKNDLVALREGSSVQPLLEKLAADEPVVLEIEFPMEHSNGRATVNVRAVVAPGPSGRRPVDRLFREGMSLPDVRARNPGELDLILLVDNKLLATYLNLCEGKAHLDLLESKDVRQKLKDNGFGVPPAVMRVKRLIKSLPGELRLLLTPDITAPDAHVFDTYFSKQVSKPGRRKRPKDNPDPPEPPPPPKPPIFRVKSLSDGLRISANPGYTEWPVNLTVRLAYADGTRRPAWSPFDFKLGDLNISHSDCTITTDRNVIRATNCGAGCRIEVTGFDRNRELDTTVRPWKHAQEN